MRQLSRPERCLSDLALDELAGDELDAQTRSSVETHIASCERCRARNDALASERAAFYARSPSFERHAEQFAGTRRRPLRYVAPAAGLAALAAIALIALRPGAGPSTRSKGSPHIGYHVKRGDSVARADTTTTLHPGDQIRFTYSSAREYHLALLSLDSRAASIYFPSGPRAVRVPPGEAIPLDFSVELDATPGKEQVLALFCVDDVELEPLRATLFQTGQLPVPSGCQLNSLVLEKVLR